MPSSRQHSYQLFGLRALAHRGLPPFMGGLCGDHSLHRTTMTQTKCCPFLHFGLWWLQLPVVSHGTEDSVPLAALKDATECAECDGGLKVPQFLFIVPSEDIPLVSYRRHLCRGAEAVSSGPANHWSRSIQLQCTDNVVDVSCAAARRAGLSISPARLRSAPHLAV